MDSDQEVTLDEYLESMKQNLEIFAREHRDNGWPEKLRWGDFDEAFLLYMLSAHPT